MSNDSDLEKPSGNSGSNKYHKKAQIKEFANSKRIHEVSCPGQIPDGLSMVHVNGNPE